MSSSAFELQMVILIPYICRSDAKTYGMIYGYKTLELEKDNFIYFRRESKR